MGDLNVMQILCAASFYNKRPPTKEMVHKYPAPLLTLMREMWATQPKDRPSMTDAKVALQQVVKGTSGKDASSKDSSSKDASSKDTSSKGASSKDASSMHASSKDMDDACLT